MAIDSTVSINSDLKEIGDATLKLASHVVELGASGDVVTNTLQLVSCFAAIYLLISNRTILLRNTIASPLIEYIFLCFPDLLFGILRDDIGRWITLVGVILHLFCYYYLPDYTLPGSLFILVVAAPSTIVDYVKSWWIGVIFSLLIACNMLLQYIRVIRAFGGFRNAFTTSYGISNMIAIVLLFVFPVWALIGLI